MIIQFSDYLTVDDGVDLSIPFSDTLAFPLDNSFDITKTPQHKTWLPPLENKKRIILQEVEYVVVSASELFHHKGIDDKYHAIYIQIDYDSGEYYVGKVNRKNWREVNRYSGSGVKFKAKYQKHSERFARYYLLICESEKETEEVEARIVNEKLLKDPFCLNLIKGGGGVSNTTYPDDRKARQSLYMKEHPERYEAMIKATQAFDAEKIRQRSQKIKEKMSSDYYKEMSRERMKKWREEHPEEYQAARAKNRESVNKPESKRKRVETLKKWKQEHPEETARWEEKRKAALNSPESRQHRGDSQKEWIKNNPEKAAERKAKARKTFAEKYSKPVEMVNLKTREVIRTFKSIKEAANWLKVNNYTSSVNPSSQIAAVCMKKQIPGHGTKKSAYGFGWEYSKK